MHSTAAMEAMGHALAPASLASGPEMDCMMRATRSPRGSRRATLAARDSATSSAREAFLVACGAWVGEAGRWDRAMGFSRAWIGETDWV